jgi:hypothetical protein
MELRRVLRPGGHLLVTAHTEHTVDYFIEHGRPAWISEDTDLHNIKKHDTYFISGNDWHGKHIFYNKKFLQKDWGRYFEVVEIRPCGIDAFHTTILLKKN